ncbi:MAG TPA: SGNH/GDSL hydrolase family protein [Leptolyngbya sp.]|jgi:lysophospholipase L1-like esterase|nr:SGNH/GDSL hydrolase family protein [Leptolyngbya sp.]
MINTFKQRLKQIRSRVALSLYDADLIEQRMTDWAQLQHYDQANAELSSDLDRVVFFGDSITEGWDLSTYFSNRSYINRGICGQTTPQMLIRFRPDVIALHPKIAVFLAGTNDIAGNTGKMSLAQTQDNFRSIAELAKYNQIKMIFASVLPVSEARSITRSSTKIQALNNWIKQYCAKKDHGYLDYYSQMVDDRGFLPSHLSDDGLHPNAAGYAIMTPLTEAAIHTIL